ncbi:unnamed protein product, partial [Brenthis ino]
MENKVKLLPNFDLRASGAAAEWQVWRTCFEGYLVSTRQDGASDKIRLALLRNMLGMESARVLLTLRIPTDKAGVYEAVINAIDKYVSPRVNQVFERFKFNDRKQKEGESFDHFLTDLKQLLLNCNFSDKSEPIEDQLLRDKIVQGVYDKRVQEQLLRLDGMTLEKAANFCRTSEQSKLQVKEMNPTCEVDANKYKKKPKSTGKFKCRRCQNLHGPRECLAFGKVCKKCGLKNHFAISCRVKKNVKLVRCQSESNSESGDDNLYCNMVLSQSKSKSEWVETILIENLPIKCKLDTGADISIMPLSIFQQINEKLSLKPIKTNIQLVSFEGSKVSPVGMVNLMCKYKNEKCFENFVIVDCHSMLLGLPGCISLNLIKRVHSAERSPVSLKDKFVSEHKNVFQGIGKLPGTFSITTKPFAEQICHPPSRIPNCLLDALKCELNRLESRKSIVKVDNLNENACINRIVLVEKLNKKIRLCLDPSDLNKYIIKKPKSLPILEELALKLNDVDVQTDHKPIVSIMSKQISKIGSPRLKRNSLNVTEVDKEMLQMVHTISKHLPMSDSRKAIFRSETNSDPVLSKDFISKCRTCEKFSPANVHEPLVPHDIPKYRYYKVGMDIMEYAGQAYLVVIDYLSHWIELKTTKLQHDKHSKSKEVVYKPGDKIVYRTDKDKNWKKGFVVKKSKEPRSYWIRTDCNSKPLRRNSHHLRKTFTDCNLLKRDFLPFEYNEEPKVLPQTKVLPYKTRSGRTIKPIQRLDL